MKFSKIIFMAGRVLFRNKIKSVINILIMMIVFLAIILAVSIKGYFNDVINQTDKYMIDSRITIISSNDSIKGNQIIKLFDDCNFVSMAINETDYISSGELNVEDNNCPLQLKSCNPDCVPDVVNGRQIDFSSSFEIIIPENFLSNNNFKNSEITDASQLIGKKLKFKIDKVDYRPIIDDVKKEYVYGGRVIGSTDIELTVVGTYDSKKYGEELYSGYVSYDSAKIWKSSDIKDKSGIYDVIYVVSRNVFDNAKVKSIAEKNNLYYSSKITLDTTMLNIINIIIFIVVSGFMIVGAVVASFSIKLECKKNISDYVMLMSYGYTKSAVSKFVLVRMLLLNIISLILTIPVAGLLSGYITNAMINAGGPENLNIHVTIISLVVSFFLCLLIAGFSVLKMYCPLSEITVKDLMKYE